MEISFPFFCAIQFGFGFDLNRRELNLEKWMTEMPQEVRNRPLLELAIPGSHDSFSYVRHNL